MDFDLNDEQRILCDSLGRLLGDNYTFETRRAIAATETGWSRAVWGQFAAMGLLGLIVPQRYGGYGGGPIEVMLVMGTFGQALTMEPYLPSAVPAATAVRIAGTDAQAAAILPALVDGRHILAWAHAEAEARHDLSYVTTTAHRGVAGWRLNGNKVLVAHGMDANRLVVSARVSGAADAEDGLGLFLVDADMPGLFRSGARGIDGTPIADLLFSDTAAEPLGAPGAGWATIRAVTETGIAAVCAEAVGAMNAAHALTVEYLKTRSQFGQLIGTYQALQHRAAEMLVALEQARSMAMLAAMMVEETDLRERALNLSRAKLIVGRSARFVGQQAVQLHGGIGMTEECAVGHYLRRLMTIEQMFGDSVHHLGLLADAT
jgi:alkylation response protein AidB-like acyl-CoA dehydrogenase